MSLRLVTNDFNHPFLTKLISDLIALFSEDDFTVDHRKYGTDKALDLWDFENIGNGLSIRIIYDPFSIHGSRQGIHHQLSSEDDAYTFVELMEQAERDSFDTIWIH